MLWNQCYPCDVYETSTDVQDFLSRQMVPALSASRKIHIPQIGMLHSLRQSVSIFALEKA